MPDTTTPPEGASRADRPVLGYEDGMARLSSLGIELTRLGMDMMQRIDSIQAIVAREQARLEARIAALEGGES